MNWKSTLFLHTFRGRLFPYRVNDYFKINNQTLPTKRILSENYPEQQSLFIEVFERLKKIEFDPLEFGYDLEKLKNRYAKEQFSKIKDIDFEDSNWQAFIAAIRNGLKTSDTMLKKAFLIIWPREEARIFDSESGPEGPWAPWKNSTRRSSGTSKL